MLGMVAPRPAITELGKQTPVFLAQPGTVSQEMRERVSEMSQRVEVPAGQA